MGRLSRLGRLGRVGRVGSIGHVGRIGSVGSIGRVGQLHAVPDDVPALVDAAADAVELYLLVPGTAVD